MITAGMPERIIASRNDTRIVVVLSCLYRAFMHHSITATKSMA